MLEGLYREWNAKINVISRQDIDNLYERHVLHSLSIARVIRFMPGTKILDAGTGGGFPGVPLAILFPEARFHLVDSTAKKLMVVREVCRSAGIENVTTEHVRLGDHRGKYDFVVSRAVSTLEEMVTLVWKNIRKDGFNDLPNGLLYLKGGDLEEEMKQLITTNYPITINYKIYPLSRFFSEPFFDSKSLVHLF